MDECYTDSAMLRMKTLNGNRWQTMKTKRLIDTLILHLNNNVLT